MNFSEALEHIKSGGMAYRHDSQTASRMSPWIEIQDSGSTIVIHSTPDSPVRWEPSQEDILADTWKKLDPKIAFNVRHPREPYDEITMMIGSVDASEAVQYIAEKIENRQACRSHKCVEYANAVPVLRVIADALKRRTSISAKESKERAIRSPTSGGW